MGYSEHPTGVGGESNHLNTHNNIIKALVNDLRGSNTAHAVVRKDANGDFEEVVGTTAGEALVWDGTKWAVDSDAFQAADGPVLVGGATGLVSVGTAAVGIADNQRIGMILPGPATESRTLYEATHIPAEWEDATVDIDVVWANLSTNSGDVALRLDVFRPAIGNSATSTSSNGTTSYLTADSQRIQVRSTIRTGVTGIYADRTLGFRFIRALSDDAGDTLDGDIIVQRFEITRVS